MHKANQKLTRRAALERAIILLSDLPDTKDIINCLQELKDGLPLAHWDKNAVFDAFDQFIIDKGAVPRSVDLLFSELPSKTVLRSQFNMTLREFVDTYYSEEQKNCENIHQMRFISDPETWIKDFSKQYSKMLKETNNRYKYISAQKYDSMREKGTPAHQTLIKCANVKTWNQLLHHAGFKTYAELVQETNVTISGKHVQPTEETLNILLDLLESEDT